MQTIPFTVDGSPHITPNLPRKSNVLHSSNGSDKRARISDHNVSFVICLFLVSCIFLFFCFIGS